MNKSNNKNKKTISVKIKNYIINEVVKRWSIENVYVEVNVSILNIILWENNFWWFWFNWCKKSSVLFDKKRLNIFIV